MDGFFNLGFIRMLEAIRSPVLNWIMQLITYCGEELVFLALAVIVLWCIDKKRGYYLLVIGFFGTIVSQFLKIYFRIPRPWIKDPNFTVVKSAKAGASGYSFPSGHTQNAISTYGGIARSSKNRFVQIFFPIFALLISFSRLYLGCHTLADVAVSLILASIFVLALWPVFRSLDTHPGRMYPIIGGMLVIAAAFLVYLKCFPRSGDENYMEALKNGYSLSGALFAFLFVYPIEKKYVRFEVKAPIAGQILKVILGLGVIVGIKSALKPLLALAFPGVLWTNAVRYFAVVLIAGLLWPLTFPLWKKIGAKKGSTKTGSDT